MGSCRKYSLANEQVVDGKAGDPAQRLNAETQPMVFEDHRLRRRIH